MGALRGTSGAALDAAPAALSDDARALAKRVSHRAELKLVLAPRLTEAAGIVGQFEGSKAVLKPAPMAWEDVLGVIELIDTPDELRDARNRGYKLASRS